MRARAVYLILCALAALFGARVEDRPASPGDFPGWPAELDGVALVPAPLDAREERFYAPFPGRVARFRRGTEDVVLRWVAAPTPRLHPASVCLGGVGWSCTELAPDADGSGRLIAERDGRRMAVTERIVDADGRVFSNAADWYWTASLGRSRGPWRAELRARSTASGPPPSK